MFQNKYKKYINSFLLKITLKVKKNKIKQRYSFFCKLYLLGLINVIYCT